MTVFEAHELDAIEEGFVESLGGKNSPLREPITATLGHPERPREVYVPQSIRAYVGEVWVHDVVGDLPIGDAEGTPRDDSPSGYYTAYLPPENLLSGRRKPGTSVYLKWVNGRWQVEGVAGVAAENYLENVPEVDYISIQRNQLQWNLIVPDAPPSGRVRLAGLRWPFGGEWRDIPDLFTIDLIAQYADDLTPGQGKAIQIEVDPTDHSIIYTEGSAFTDTSLDLESGAVEHPAVFSQYPKATDIDLIHYGWVKVYHHMLEISEQDIYIAPDTGGGGGGGGASALDDLTDVTITSPLEGHVLYYNGSAWVNRYAWDGFYLEGPNAATTIPANDNADLDFLINYDSAGFYSEGTNTLTLPVGVYSLKALLRFSVATTLSTAGRVHVSISGTFAGSGNASHGHTLFLPSGTPDTLEMDIPVHAGGFIGSSQVFSVNVINACDEDLTVAYCSIVGDRHRP